MAALTAIDYGTSRVRLLEFDGSGRKIRVLKVVDVDLAAAVADEADADPEDLRAEAIADAMDDARISTDPSAMAFDAGSALFREFNLPFTNDDQVNKVVRFEAESHIPLDIDDVVVQHVVLRKSRDKSHILAAAVKKEDLLDRFDILDASNLDPMFVEMDVFALYHALVGTGAAEEHDVAVVVNANEASTSLLFLVDGKLFAVRSLRMGTHGIQATDDVGDEQFVFVDDEETPVTAPAPSVDEPAMDRDLDTARAHDYLGRLKREIRRTLTTLPTMGEVEAVWICGSGSRIEGFREAMRESFGVSAEALDLLGRVDHKLSADDVDRLGPDIGVALGLAYKLNGLDLTSTDFRREECAYTRKFDQVKSPLIVLSFLAFLIVALECIDAIYENKRVETEYSYLIGDAQDMLEQLKGDNAEARKVWEGVPFGPQQVDRIARAIDTIHDEKAQILGRSERIPKQDSALAVWIEFSDLMRRNEEKLGRLWITTLDINVTGRTPEIRFAGVVEDPANGRPLALFNRLLNMLENDPLYTRQIKLGGQNYIDGQTRLEFKDTIFELDLEVLRQRVEAQRESA